MSKTILTQMYILPRLKASSASTSVVLKMPDAMQTYIQVFDVKAGDV